MNQQLSPAAQATLDSLKDLPPADRDHVLALANQVNNAASATTPEQRAAASSKLDSGVQDALAQSRRGNLEAPLQTRPSAPVSHARVDFDAISVRVPFNGKFFDVAVPNEMVGKSRSDQTAMAGKIGGDIGPRELNRAVANYLLDREAFDLLAKEKAGTITKEQTKLLDLHREKWKQDKGAETRAKVAGEITEKQAALLKVYREKWVGDTAGGLGVVGVRVEDLVGFAHSAFPGLGELVVCPSAESKSFDL